MARSKVRTVPVMVTLSGMMLLRLPPWIMPMVTMAAAVVMSD